VDEEIEKKIIYGREGWGRQMWFLIHTGGGKKSYGGIDPVFMSAGEGESVEIQNMEGGRKPYY